MRASVLRASDVSTGGDPQPVKTAVANAATAAATVWRFIDGKPARRGRRTCQFNRLKR